MEALKLGLVAFLLSVFAIGFCHNEPKPEVQKSCCIKIALENAIESRSFARDIYNQVDPIILRGGDENRLYYAKVRHGRGIYLVFGKYREWEEFFLREGRIIGPPDMNAKDLK